MANKTTTTKTTKSPTIPKKEKVSSTNTVVEDKVVVNNKVETQEISETKETPVYSFKKKETIPLDAEVMVKNCVHGKLIYKSKTMNGFTLTWSEFGEEIPVTMRELHQMKNSDRIFFTENWVQVDPIVLRDLGMERFYENTYPIDDMEKLFEMTPDELSTAIDTMKETMRNAFVLEAMRKIEDGTFTDFRLINTIESKLNCELYEH